MNNSHLPNDLLPGTSTDRKPEHVYILNYESAVASIKNKFVLTHHLFNFLLEGEKTVYYAGGKAVVDSARFLFLSAGNCLMSEKVAGPAGKFKSILLFFDNTALNDFFIKYPGLLNDIKKEAQAAPFFLFDKDEFLQNFIHSLSLLLAPGRETAREMQVLKFEEVMLYLCHKYPHQIRSLQKHLVLFNEDAEIRMAVEANIESNITVEELAFLCNTSASTFKRRFARIYGTSPNKWMLQKRMELAAGLLRNGQANASDIYDRLGYESLSSFIQSFKQVFGVTPKKYQAKI
jgi:AraC family transcriptional regulator, exoenzyme S synthesis regulatory protein ExsA